MNQDVRTMGAAVLRPFRHSGDCNYLHSTMPGPLFTSLDEQPHATEPIVIVTTVGWSLVELDMTRVREFSNGVVGVRISMTAVEGLHWRIAPRSRASR